MIPLNNHLRLNPHLLAATFLILGSGLFMFIAFHIGPGSVATEFAGISKNAWRDAHRIAAVLWMALIALHLYRHTGVLQRLVTRFPRRAGQLLLLTLGGVVSITGLAAWCVLPHGVPSLAETRHAWIDVHNIAGLALLIGTIHHLGHRWRLLWKHPRPARSSHRDAGAIPHKNAGNRTVGAPTLNATENAEPKA